MVQLGWRVGGVAVDSSRSSDGPMKGSRVALEAVPLVASVDDVLFGIENCVNAWCLMICF